MKYTVYVMAAIGAAFWIAALLIPGYTVWMIFFAAVLIAWCVYWLLTDEGDTFVKRWFADSESGDHGDD